jgi:HEAT repeat protein
MNISPSLKALLKALEAKECVFFVGSGISRWSGLPDWEGLIEKMIDFLGERGLDRSEKREIKSVLKAGDLLTAASLCTSRLRKSDLRDLIDLVFVEPSPRPHEIHTLITSLGPDSFVTTNYDRLIEDAYQETHKGIVLTPVNNDQPPEQARIMKHGASRFVFNLHGRADRIDTVILSREDYRKLQYTAGATLKTLEHLLLSRPVVYLGFSLRDPDFLMIKDQIASTFQSGERDHFAILPNVGPMVRKFWKDNYGVNVISYRSTTKEGHLQLLELLQALRDALTGADLAHNDLMDRKRSNESARSASIRFCETVLHTPALEIYSTQVFATIRQDLSPRTVSVYPTRHTPIDRLLRCSGNITLIGEPGSGKTFAIQQLARSIAGTTITELRQSASSSEFKPHHSLPLILPMSEYSGSIETMVATRIPRSLDAMEALRAGQFIIMFDAVNEAPRAFTETKHFPDELSRFIKKFPLNRYIVTSRSSSYIPSLGFPVYELNPVPLWALENLLESRGFRPSHLPEPLLKAIANPFLLSLFLRGADVRAPEIATPAHLLQKFFAQASERTRLAFGKSVPLQEALSKFGYELVSRGVQRIQLTEADALLAKALDRGFPEPTSSFLNFLVSIGVLTTDSEGNLGFFHQTALEFIAANSLLGCSENGSLKLAEYIDYRRWDETIILLIGLLPEQQAIKLLEEIVGVDIFLACRAFESSALKNEKVALHLFDAIARLAREPTTPPSLKKDLAAASLKLVPFGRKETLREWLIDPLLAKGAAIFLARMNAAEMTQPILQLLLNDNVWPSDFAMALSIFVDDTLIKQLIAEGRVINKDNEGSLAVSNIADVLATLESDYLYTEIEALKISLTSSDRELAAEILRSIESERSIKALATMLRDPSHEVRWRVILGLSRDREDRDTFDTIVDDMFFLLPDSSTGYLAADYLRKQITEGILSRADHRLKDTDNTIEIINLCSILSAKHPQRAKKILFRCLQNFDRETAEALRNALAQLPPDLLIPDILNFAHTKNEDLRNCIFETFSWLFTEEDITISREDAEWLLGLWEIAVEEGDLVPLSHLEYALKTIFRGTAKSLVLERLLDEQYKFRKELVRLAANLSLTRAEVPFTLLEWLLTQLGEEARDDFFDWNPVSRIIGATIEEGAVREKLLPLLLSSNPVIRNNTYLAIREAERRLGRRFLKA